MNDYEPTPCFNDYVRICREQQDRIESLELAITAVCEEIDHGASVTVARSMLRSAMQDEVGAAEAREDAAARSR